MYPSGIIYQSGKSSVSGEFNLKPPFAKRLSYHLLRGVGAGFVAFAVVGVIFSFWPIVKEEFSYRFLRSKVQVSKFGDILDRAKADDAEQVIKETADLGIDPYFSINIPQIEAHANIVPNVNTGDAGEYLEALTEGVAHAKGTNFPGQGKTVYLFSHSTDSPLNFARYNAVFYLLGKLKTGDRITVYFLGKKHTYLVTDKLITKPSDTSWLKDNGEGERLVLQTCDPPGTSWNRLIIVARPLK